MVTVGCGSAETSGTVQASVLVFPIKLWSSSVGTKESCLPLKLYGLQPFCPKPKRGLAQGLPMVVFKTIVMLDLFSRYKTVGVEV